MIKKYLSFVVCFFCINFAWSSISTGHTVNLVLEKMMPYHQQELFGDEVYFDLAIHQKGQPTQYQRIPQKPFHWSIDKIQKQKETIIWSGQLQEDNSFIIVASLMESDASVLNPDELIGVVRLKLTKHDGKINVDWAMPNNENFSMKTRGIKNESKKFVLKQGPTHYDIWLKLKEN